ncbi:MAG: hypothetical protein ACRENH_17460 [Gemmatimonadaceae bacterium]
MPNGSMIERALWTAALHKAAQAGLGIAPGCEHELKQFIRAGVQAMQTESRITDVDYLNLAEANLLAFVARMIIEARRQGMSDLHEGTFFTSKTSLCPLWPFC